MGKDSNSSKGPNAGVTAALYFDGNTYKYWFVIISSGVLTHYLFINNFNILWLLLTLLLATVVSVVTDILYYFLGLKYYDPTITIVRGYSASAYFNDTLHSVGLDYGFNYYNGDYTKTRSQAQIDKFNCAIKQLGIQQGDRIIDIGCGCGDWLFYLQNIMKCTVVGVNITDTQAEQARQRGLTIFTTDWKDIKKNAKLRETLYGQFDCVTFWDTVEHYVPFGFGIWNRKGRAEIYQDMFELASNLIDKNSRLQHVWISCLHNRFELCPKNFIYSKLLCHETEQPKPYKGKKGKLDKDEIVAVNDWNIRQSIFKWYCIYLLDKFHSGFYPSYYYENGKFNDELVDNGEIKGFDLYWREDTTLDYYMTSKLNPTHFGRHRLNFTSVRIFAMFLVVLVDPFWLHHILWYTIEAWMEQFEPSNINQSMTILWWLTFKLKK